MVFRIKHLVFRIVISYIHPADYHIKDTSATPLAKATTNRSNTSKSSSLQSSPWLASSPCPIHPCPFRPIPFPSFPGPSPSGVRAVGVLSLFPIARMSINKNSTKIKEVLTIERVQMRTVNNLICPHYPLIRFCVGHMTLLR